MFLVLAAACSDADSDPVDRADITGGAAALCSNFFFTDPRAGYVRLVSDEELEAGQEIDGTSEAVEFTGGVSCIARNQSIFAGSWESPTLTRLDVVDGALVEGERLSFANLGLATAQFVPDRETALFLSEEKAYFLDIRQGLIIIWNPSTMEISGSIQLEGPQTPDGIRRQFYWGRLVGDQYIVFSDYRDDRDLWASRTDFWFIDTATDQVVATDGVEDCGRLNHQHLDASGDLYMGTDFIAVAEYALGLHSDWNPCVIRIPAGAVAVDADYRADLNALTGGLPTYGAIQLTEDRALVVAYDTGNAPADPRLNAVELLQVPSWNLYEWRVGSEAAARRLDGIPSGGGSVTTLGFDGRVFLARQTPDFAATELIDPLESPLEPAYRFTGVTYLIERLGPR